MNTGARSRAGKATEKEAPDAAGGGFWEQISTLLVAILIALCIRAFVVEPFRIPSGSMLPTLLIGDHLFVNKFIYGIKVPFTDYRLPGLREPEAGDVIVFTVAKRAAETFPADRRPDLPREEFVKRVVGVPGDRIEFRRDSVYVNGEPMDVKDLGEPFADDVGRQLQIQEVTLPEHSYRILDDPRQKLSIPRTSVVVEPGRYFVLGDNRDHSKDSRFWGTVRLAEIKGPAFILYWSWDFNGTWGQLANPVTWWRLLTEKMRWSRIGDRVV